MLRLCAILLLLVNMGYYAWSVGALRSWGLAPVEESEPQHGAQQIEPEALRIVPATPQPPPLPTPQDTSATAGATRTPAVLKLPSFTLPPTAASSGECLQAGLFDTAQADAWRRAASGLPPGSWRLERSTTPERWMIYMGPFADTDVLAKKRIELSARKVSFDRPGNPALEPGLVLGHFPSEERAKRALVSLSNRGVRTARVLIERPETDVFTLRLPLVDAALRARLTTLQSALAGKPLRSCF
ncbi:MAG: SPOR domain-containing protein [Simplicispira sp.]|nr:SPOR domain-containing protein [Simplicispira sp.]